MPRFLVRASATLFEQGLADPRGGDYRAIEIAVGSVWSNVAGSSSRLTAGSCPRRQAIQTRFAVTWSGLVYPTVSVGAPADLEADVKTLEDAARARRKAADEAAGPGRGRWLRRVRDQPRGDSRSRLTGVHPIKVALLLRIGRADLAEKVWAAAMGRPREEAGKARPVPTSPTTASLT